MGRMLGLPTLAPVLLVTLVVTCSGDDAPLTPTATAPPLATPAPATAPPEPRLQVSDPQPFTIVPLTGPTPTWPEDISDGAGYPRRLVYDQQTGSSVIVDRGDGVVWAGWLGDSRLLVRLDDWPGIYDAESGTWSVIELGFDLGIISNASASPDGSRIALEGPDGQLVLLDMRAVTYQTVGIQVRLGPWSPDSTHLLLQARGEPAYFVIDADNLAAPLALPTDSPTLEDPGYSGWLDSTRISMSHGYASSGRRITEVDISGPQLTVGPDIEVEDGGVSLSPDENHFSVSRAGFQVSDEFTSRTVFYRREPFEIIAAYDGIALASYRPSAWTTDGGRVIALREPCSENETLILLDIATGAQTDLAPVGTSQLAFSPDETLVAFGASPGDAAGLFIVPAAGSAPPEAVFQLPGAYGAVSDPQWSADGRFISFGLGGFGRCP